MMLLLLLLVFPTVDHLNKFYKIIHGIWRLIAFCPRFQFENAHCYDFRLQEDMKKLKFF
jgi:hypothetical protein